jgi:hypothetical protein
MPHRGRCGCLVDGTCKGPYSCLFGLSSSLSLSPGLFPGLILILSACTHAGACTHVLKTRGEPVSDRLALWMVGGVLERNSDFFGLGSSVCVSPHLNPKPILVGRLHMVPGCM